MKKIMIIILSIVSLHLVSCRFGLNELPVFDEANIISVSFETRWVDQVTGALKVQALSVSDLVINNDAGTISLKLTVPSASTYFTTDIRNAVTKSSLLLYCQISNAATVFPIGTTPPMGTVGDFSQSNLQYEVNAADGKTKKTWTLIITDFVK